MEWAWIPTSEFGFDGSLFPSKPSRWAARCADETGTAREHASVPVGTSDDASLVQRVRARDGNAFRTITKEVTNVTGSSRKCASYRNEATNQTLLNDRSLMNQQCVSDSGELATRSSQNFGSIESGLRSVPRFRNSTRIVMVRKLLTAVCFAETRKPA
jgi:hypothetical protein